MSLTNGIFVRRNFRKGRTRQGNKGGETVRRENRPSGLMNQGKEGGGGGVGVCWGVVAGAGFWIWCCKFCAYGDEREDQSNSVAAQERVSSGGLGSGRYNGNPTL